MSQLQTQPTFVASPALRTSNSSSSTSSSSSAPYHASMAKAVQPPESKMTPVVFRYLDDCKFNSSGSALTYQRAILKLEASTPITKRPAIGDGLLAEILTNDDLTPKEKYDLLTLPRKAKASDKIINLNLLVYTFNFLPNQFKDCIPQIRALIRDKQFSSTDLYNLLQFRYYKFESVTADNHEAIAMLRERIFCHQLAAHATEDDQIIGTFLLNLIQQLANSNSRQAFSLLHTKSHLLGKTLGHYFAKIPTIFTIYLRMLRQLLTTGKFTPDDIFELRVVESNSNRNSFATLIKLHPPGNNPLYSERYFLTEEELNRLGASFKPQSEASEQKDEKKEERKSATTMLSSTSESSQKEEKSSATNPNPLQLFSKKMDADIEEALKEALIELHRLYITYLQYATRESKSNPLLKVYSSLFPENTLELELLSIPGLTPDITVPLHSVAIFNPYSAPPEIANLEQLEAHLQAITPLADSMQSRVLVSNTARPSFSSWLSSSSSSVSTSTASERPPLEEQSNHDLLYLGLAYLVQGNVVKKFLSADSKLELQTTTRLLGKILELVKKLPPKYLYPLLLQAEENQNNLGMQICLYCNDNLLTIYFTFLITILAQKKITPLQVLNTLCQTNQSRHNFLISQPQKLSTANFDVLLDKLIAALFDAGYPADYIFNIFDLKTFLFSNHFISAYAGPGNRWYFDIDTMHNWISRGISPAKFMTMACDVVSDKTGSSTNAATNALLHFSRDANRQKTSEICLKALTELVTNQGINPEIMFKALMFPRIKIANSRYNFFQVLFMPWNLNYHFNFSLVLADFLKALNPKLEESTIRSSYWVKTTIEAEDNEELLKLFWKQYNPERRGELLFHLGKNGIFLDALNYKKDLLHFLGYYITLHQNLLERQIQCLDPRYFFGWWIWQARLSTTSLTSGSCNIVIGMLALSIELKLQLIKQIEFMLEANGLRKNADLYNAGKTLIIKKIYVGYMDKISFIPCTWESEVADISRTIAYNCINFAKIILILRSQPNFGLLTAQAAETIINQIVRDSKTGLITDLRAASSFELKKNEILPIPEQAEEIYQAIANARKNPLRFVKTTLRNELESQVTQGKISKEEKDSRLESIARNFAQLASSPELTDTPEVTAEDSTRALLSEAEKKLKELNSIEWVSPKQEEKKAEKDEDAVEMSTITSNKAKTAPTAKLVDFAAICTPLNSKEDSKEVKKAGLDREQNGDAKPSDLLNNNFDLDDYGASSPTSQSSSAFAAISSSSSSSSRSTAILTDSMTSGLSTIALARTDSATISQLAAESLSSTLTPISLAPTTAPMVPVSNASSSSAEATTASSPHIL